MPSISSTAPHYAIVGGGISGLSAAYRLSKLTPKARITLLESTDRLGGVLHTVRSDDLLFERGADSFITRIPWAVQLCQELGIDDQLLPTSEIHRRAMVVRAGRLHPVPEGFVIMRPERILPLIFSPILSLQGKLRVLTEPWRGRPDDVQRSDFDESVASFARRRLGKEAFDRLVQPLLAGIYTADPEKLSLAATMPEFLKSEREHGSMLRAVWKARRKNAHQRENVHQEAASHASGARYSLFVTLRYGLESMVTALSDALPTGTIQLNCQVSSIYQGTKVGGNANPWFLRIKDKQTLRDQKIGPLNGIILATPAPHAAMLLAGLDANLADLLRQIDYAGASVVSLVYKRQQIGNPLDSFGFVVPAVEGRQIIAASFSSVKFPDRVAQDRVVIRVFLGGASQPKLIDLPDQQIRTLATQELSDLLDIQGEPLLVDIARWQARMPQYHVGHLRLIDTIDRHIAKYAGLELAGNAYRGVGIPQCIHSGQLAADRLSH